jgi:hypothetical protein
MISATANAGKTADKDANDLEAVTGNAEDDIGDLVASVRERELLYGEDSLLAVYGGMIAHICSAPKAFKVSTFSCVMIRTMLTPRVTVANSS